MSQETKIIEDEIVYKVGESYKFSDSLQKDKAFRVEWKEGVLKGCLPVNGTSCKWHYGKSGISYYIRKKHKLNRVIDELDYLVRNDFTMLKNSLVEMRNSLEEIRDKEIN